MPTALLNRQLPSTRFAIRARQAALTPGGDGIRALPGAISSLLGNVAKPIQFPNPTVPLLWNVNASIRRSMLGARARYPVAGLV